MKTGRNIEAIVDKEAMLWGDNVAEKYHAEAEFALNLHWEQLVVPAFQYVDVDLRSCVDFACGRGRNTEKLLSAGASNVVLVDVNAENIRFCQERFRGRHNCKFLINNGFDIAGIQSSSVSLFYSLDAMVHFDIEIVVAYIAEIARTLSAGGVGIIHHSNYTMRPGSDFRTNPHWRNYMSAEIFRHVAMLRGLEVVHQKVFDWGNLVDSDCVSVLRKPV
jgi:ubiquinone/menaquinone biosynthesis C-methylase UbiE